MIHSFLLVNRRGKVRLAKWYDVVSQKERQRIVKDLISTIITRTGRLCNFFEWNDKKVVYRKYASLYFIAIVDKDDNELIQMEIIQAFVEVLDKFFGEVCEIDLIFHFHSVFFVLEEMVIGGEFIESSKQEVLKILESQEQLFSAINPRSTDQQTKSKFPSV